jgi:hypothetical protein
VKLPDHRLVPRLRIDGTITSIPPYAFMACTETASTLSFSSCNKTARQFLTLKSFERGNVEGTRRAFYKFFPRHGTSSNILFNRVSVSSVYMKAWVRTVMYTVTGKGQKVNNFQSWL